MCSRCDIVKPITDFNPRPNSKYINGACRECTRKITAGYRYRLTLDEVNEMLKVQDYKCAVCGDHMVKPSIDHDHKCCPSVAVQSKTCGQCTRALLCTNCNLAGGSLKDDWRRAVKLARYLKDWDEVLGTG